MAKVQDLRGVVAAKEANAHTKNLEEIVKSSSPSFFKKTINQLFSFTATAGAGCIAGYAISGGKIDSAVYTAEYAALAWAGWKLPVDAQIAGIHFLYRNVLKKHIDKIKRKITQEYIKAKKIEKRLVSDTYTPKYGVEFTNSPFNIRAVFENQLKESYCKNIETARKPIRSVAAAIVGSSLALFFGTFAADVSMNMLHYITGLNPLEFGISVIHYTTQNLQALIGYVPTAEYNYRGDFPQGLMLLTGATLGAMKTTKEFFIGNYYRAKALLSRNAK